jgi:hypothetical protein
MFGKLYRAWNVMDLGGRLIYRFNEVFVIQILRKVVCLCCLLELDTARPFG